MSIDFLHDKIRKLKNPLIVDMSIQEQRMPSHLLEQERCVNEIAEAVELSQSAVSHQLRILKQMHLIKFRREGKNIWYSLADDHVKTILEMGLEHAMCDD